MKSKKELIILIVIIIVLGAYLYFQKNGDRIHYEMPVLPALEENDITGLEVIRKETTVELRKRDDTWYVEPGGFTADQSRIIPMLDAVLELNLTALVSESGNDHRYDLDDEQRIRVRVFSRDRELRVVDIGKTAPSHQHTFVRLAGDDRIYHARGNFRSRFERSRSDLMDKTVLTVNRDQVRQIHIVRPHNPPLVLRLVEKPAQDRKDETEATDAVAEPTYVWQDGQGNPVSETKINNLLQTVSDLKCREFIEDTSEKSDPSPLITVTVNDGMEHTLKIFEKHDPEDTAYPAVSSETDHPFLLAQFTVEDILNFFVDETDPEEES